MGDERGGRWMGLQDNCMSWGGDVGGVGGVGGISESYSDFTFTARFARVCECVYVCVCVWNFYVLCQFCSHDTKTRGRDISMRFVFLKRNTVERTGSN